MSKSVTFLTRNYPPSLNINGESVCDMVEYLSKEFPEVVSNVVFIDKVVAHGGKQRQPLGNLVKVKNRLDKNNVIFKGLKMLLDGYWLAKAAKRTNADLYIVTTSPPLLPFWTRMLFGKNRKQVLWALDLFPEMFAAKGTISANNPLYKWIIKKTYSRSPEYVIALGEQQAQFIEKACYKGNFPTVLLPCGAFDEAISTEIPAWHDPSKIIIGYCGNVHDAHNPDFIEHMITAIDSEKHLLVLALYGSKAPKLLELAKDKPGIVLVNSVPRNQLPYIDVHMVTLLPEFTHCAVPSKAVSAVTMGRPILFCGREDCDNWAMFNDSGWFIPDAPEMKTEIARFCLEITKEEILEKAQNAARYGKKLEDVVSNTYRYIGESIVNA